MDPEKQYSIDYYERVAGDKYPSLGSLAVGPNPPKDRIIGSPGIREEVITAPLVLVKGAKEVTVDASPKKPRKVLSMVTFFDPIPLPFWVHPQTALNQLELELKKVGVRLCHFNGLENANLDTVLQASDQREIFRKYLHQAKGRGVDLDNAIDKLLEKLN